MWGNSRGWLISVSLTLLTALSLFIIETRGRPTPPDEYGLDPANTAELSLPPPTLVVPDMTVESDSTAMYRQAMAECLARREVFDFFARTRSEEPRPEIDRALEHLLAGRTSRRAAFSANPGELIHYKNDTPSLQALELVFRCALISAARKSDEERRKLLEAVFSLGFKLFEERLTYRELDLGMRLMAESAAALKQMSARSDGSAVQDIADFDAARLKLAREVIKPIAERIVSVDGNIVRRNAGNIIHWTNAAGDRVWRVEAILAAGRLRYFAGEKGRGADRAAADAALDRLDEGPERNPAFRAAAEAARKLSAEDFRLLR